jgi:hypothetical protein
VKPILEAIDGISKSCLETLELFRDQNMESRPVFEKLGYLVDCNQVLLKFFIIQRSLYWQSIGSSTNSLVMYLFI